jgi:Flp pilus assembly protein TadG
MLPLLHALRRLATNRRGGTIMLFALLLGPIIMFTGAAVDYARLAEFKSQLQATVDSAALAGAAAYTSQSANSNAVSVATDYVNSSVGLLPPHVGSLTPVVSASNVTSGSNQGYTVTVQATTAIPTTFMRILTAQLPVSASASAVNPATKVCILILDPSSSQSFLVNSGVQLNAPNCMIDVASDSSSAAMINSSLTDIAGLCVDGNAVVNGGSSINNLTVDCTTASDPYANTIPAPSISTSCTVSNQNYSGTTTLSPGTYCGSINFNGGGTVTFRAGNYVFYNTTVNFNGSGTLSFGAGVYSLKGTKWNLNSGWAANGTGVTFYFADANSYIQFNSNVKVNLAAPTSGTYANVLIFEPNGLATSSFAIDGTSTSDLLQGLIYLPSRNITFNSTTNDVSDGLTLVAHQVIFDTMNWTIAPNAKSISGSSAHGDRLTM